MSIVTGALGSLAPKLFQLLHGEYKLQKDVREQVQWLSDELDSIYPLLRKVSDVPWDRLDEQVKVWARKVREASYDMEDVLDTDLVRVKQGGEPADPSRLKCAMKKMGKIFTKAKARRDISGAIEDIKKHLEEVAERRQKYKLDEIMCKPLVATSAIDPRLKAMYKEVTQLIGVDKSRDELISILDPSQPDLVVSNKKIKKVSIVGVGGLGKTTLAKVVYDKLKSQYDCGAFVSIGRDPDLVKVFKDVLFHLDETNHREIHIHGLDVKLLIHQLRKFLETKRYFIVIDDVWEVQTWEAIELALVENSCGSKVITTTRRFDVAEKAGEVYKLNPLSYDESMKLFNARIFCADRKYLYNQSNEVSDKVLKKCAGIPLAVITMVSLFASKPECEWSKVYKSIGFDTKHNREAEDTMTILSFSYYDLPPHLRTSLLYLSKYPEDSVIQKDILIRKWIAEGFINADQGTRLFEIGEIYFNDLINRSLIQAVESQWSDGIEYCRVHDMVLDLMRKLSFEENFIVLLGNNLEGTDAPRSVRRLVHQNITSEQINSEAMVTGMPKVRSYTAFMCFIDSRDQFLRFKLLRVLDIVSCKFKEGFHLDHLSDLLHLSYLGITCDYGSDVPELPKQIGNLNLLQTIQVYGTLLPASIVHLTKLVRLCADRVPDGIGKLVFLEELIMSNHVMVMPKNFLKELVSLRELRVLEFSIGEMDESMQKDFAESLSNLPKIQYICVHNLFFTGVDTSIWEATGFVLGQPLRYLNWCGIELSKLPSCISPSRLPNLFDLQLRLTTIGEEDLKLLASLPALCYLHLRIITKFTITACNINSGDRCFFKKLRHFKIDAMVQFEQPNEEDSSVSLLMWNGEEAMPFVCRKSNDPRKVVLSGVMPNLEVLDFEVPLRALKDNNGDCTNIGLEYLPSLQKVTGYIDCEGVAAKEVDATLAELRHASMVHPNHPTLDMNKYNEAKMVTTAGGGGGDGLSKLLALIWEN